MDAGESLKGETMTDNERQQVLKMVEDGKISAEEGLKLMQALDEDSGVPEGDIVHSVPDHPSEAEAKSDPEFDRKFNRFRRLWMIPLWIGVLITVTSAYWMYSSVQSSGLGFWFYCSWVPFLLGVAAIALGFDSRTSRWIYVDVHQPLGEYPQRILISFPLSPVSWLVGLFGSAIPTEHKSAIDDVMRAIFRSADSEEPLFVDVHDKDGQHVQVYIG
jgi:hypothetical protein